MTPKLQTETDPLLGEAGDEEESKTTTTNSEEARKSRRRFSSLAALLLTLVIGFFANAVKNQQPLEGHVEVTEAGDFTVLYNRNVTSRTTFAQAAELMLIPWFDATMLAMDELKPDVLPQQVHNARKVFLRTRDLLDVFSPVYPTNSMWERLRKYFKEGYEKTGYFQDLITVDDSEELLKERRTAVLDWKKRFVSYSDKKHPRAFLSRAIDKHGCYEHRASHLFWGHSEQLLPCGYDLVAKSLQDLAKVQLGNSLRYLEEIRNYKTVLEQEKVETFHNLRKQLRCFLDEYKLFGFLLLPNAKTSDIQSEELTTVSDAVKSLGRLHDDWTAYDIYVSKGTHKKKQEELVKTIDEKWKEFHRWAYDESERLETTLQSLINDMDPAD